MFSKSVIVSTEAKNKITGLPDVDSITDMLKQERKALETSQKMLQQMTLQKDMIYNNL